MYRGASLLALIIGLAACGGEPSPDATTTDESETQTTEELGPEPMGPGIEQSTVQDPDNAGSALVEEEDFDPEIATWVEFSVTVEATGQPHTNAPVAVYWSRGGDAGGRVMTTTDGTGRGRVGLLHRTFVQSVVAMGTGETAPQSVSYDRFVGPEERELIELSVKPAARFSGRVIDLDGNPVPGAKLRGWPEDRWQVEGMNPVEPTTSGTADDQGLFRIGGMPGGRFLLTAEMEGMLCVQRAAGTNEFDAEITNIELVMSPANLVDGQLLNSDGRGIGGVRVEAGEPRRRVNFEASGDERFSYLPPRHWIVETDPEGGFQLPAVPVGDRWNFVARHNRYRELREKLQPGQQIVQFTMADGLEIHMQIRNTDGEAINHGDVVLLGIGAKQEGIRGGAAALKGLEDDPDAIVLLRSTGYAMKKIWPVDYNSDANPLEVILEPAQPIRGQVVDGAGEAIGDVQLTARGLDFLEPEVADLYPGPQPEAVFQLNEKRSNEEGRFLFGQLYGGRWEITAKHADGRSQVQTVEAGTTDLTFVFE